MAGLSDAQADALSKLSDNGGEGVLDKHASIVAGGVRLRFMPETWLRLLLSGHVQRATTGRIAMTSLGSTELAAFRQSHTRKSRPETIHASADGRVRAHEGSE